MPNPAAPSAAPSDAGPAVPATPAAPAAYQVTTTLPDRPAADRLAGQLVQERLVACVQVVGPVASVYRWNGAVERAEEWQCQCKTTAHRLDAVRARIKELHSYEVPEIVAAPLTADAAYLAWIEESVSP